MQKSTTTPPIQDDLKRLIEEAEKEVVTQRGKDEAARLRVVAGLISQELAALTLLLGELIKGT